MQGNSEKNWWHPQEFAKKRENLAIRAKIIKAIRGYFEANGFDEVQTPVLQTCPVIDTHIRAFATDLRGVDGQIQKTVYLHTSPEFAMKKLLVAGMSKIYQICPVFRNAEGSKRHLPEFTMLEWYRTNADYNAIMDDCEELLKSCAQAAGITHYRYKDAACDPFTKAQRITVSEAFKKFADINLEDCLDNTASLREQVRGLGLHTAEDDCWDDLFFRVMDAKIEPFLGINQPTFLCDYPVCMASLSKKKQGDPRFAERFELYVCGIELANAFSELTDAQEQKRRYEVEMNEKERLYQERYPLDEEFIAALTHGMPESGGIALGLDRLIMLATNEQDIRGVVWC